MIQHGGSSASAASSRQMTRLACWPDCRGRPRDMARHEHWAEGASGRRPVCAPSDRGGPDQAIRKCNRPRHTLRPVIFVRRADIAASRTLVPGCCCSAGCCARASAPVEKFNPCSGLPTDNAASARLDVRGRRAFRWRPACRCSNAPAYCCAFESCSCALAPRHAGPLAALQNSSAEPGPSSALALPSPPLRRSQLSSNTSCGGCLPRRMAVG